MLVYILNVPPPKVTQALRDTLLHEFSKRILASSDLADVMPVYKNFWIDDSGRIWVLLENPLHKQEPLIIFKSDGTPAWKTMIPAQLGIHCIKNHFVYGIWRDKDGMTSIVRYTVKFS